MVALQRAFADRNQNAAESVSIKVGINAGEPIEEAGDLFGSVVQFAARLCADAEAGQVLVSDVVRQLAGSKGFKFVDAGERDFKGFAQRVKVFELVWRNDIAPTFGEGHRQSRSLTRASHESQANVELVHEPGVHPYWYEELGYHRVGVRNNGPASAEGVAVTLLSIVPPPPYKEMNPLPSRLGEKGGYCKGNSCDIHKGDEHLYDVLRDMTPQGMPRGSVWGLLTIENTDWMIGLKEDTDYFFEVRITAKNLAGDARCGYVRVRQGHHGGLDIELVDSLPSGLAP